MRLKALISPKATSFLGYERVQMRLHIESVVWGSMSIKIPLAGSLKFPKPFMLHHLSLIVWRERLEATIWDAPTALATRTSSPRSKYSPFSF